MIRVLYEPGIPRLTVEGHAGTAPAGEDLICAAASMLVQTLRACTGLGEVGKGRARLTGRPEERPVFDALSTGFRLLAEGYPECVAFTCRGGY